MSPSSSASELKLTGLIGSLRCCQLFSSLSEPDLRQIASFASSINLAKEDYLFHEGEASRGGALFPHLYAPLPVAAAIGERPLAVDADGVMLFDDGAVGWP